MKRLVQEIIDRISKRMTMGTTNLVKLENFDSPVIYMSVCKYFKLRNDIQLTGIIDINKYNYFVNKSIPEWDAALDYLKTNGFVSEDVPLTKLRNEAAASSSGTSLLLLMGAESAVDKGSIKDFNSISMGDLVDTIKRDYSKWFEAYLKTIDACSKENSEVLNNIYKAVFQYNNVDAVKFSDFIDSLDSACPESMSDLVEYIFSTLDSYWNMPAIKSYIPKLTSMRGKKAVKVIISAYEFINNKLNLSPAKIKSLPKKFDEFAAENSINVDDPYMGFDTYSDFKDAAIEFLNYRNIDNNRLAFMKADYGIINKIFGLKTTIDDKLDPPDKDKIVSLSGDPLDVYLQMVICSCLRFKEKFNGVLPQELILSVNMVELSNCVDDNDSEKDNDGSVMAQYLNICSYLGGLVTFINENGLKDKHICLKYDEDGDPFDQNNAEKMSGKLKDIKKWGVNSQITFTIKACGDSAEEIKSYEFKWVFSPYASWKNAFSLLSAVYSSDIEEKVLPLLLYCDNMPDHLGCESENEFFIKLESMHYYAKEKDYRKIIKNAFAGSALFDKFNLVNSSFEAWCDSLFDTGFFNCIDKMNAMIDYYINMISEATSFYAECSTAQKEKISLLLNSYSIVSNNKYLENYKVSEVIVPSYNPAMLEKINAQNFFTIYSFSELFSNLDGVTESNYRSRLNEIKKLAEITQCVDMIPDGNGGSLTCRNIWGYYAVYYSDNSKIPYISNIELVQDEVNEENAQDHVSEFSQSKVIEHNISDYIKTFPSRVDGLNVCFVAPKEVQYVVAGIGKVADALSKSEVEAVINVKIICFGGTKNVSGYLRFWLNNYMSKERSVKINAYLRYIREDYISSDLPKLLENQDLCFIYDILKNDTVKFEPYAIDSDGEKELVKYCQFPMTFIPDTITGSHGRKRKVNISQMQFLVSRAYTQLAHRVTEPNSVNGEFKVMQQLSLDNDQQDVLDIAHEQCRWVVCEDRAIDRALLQTGEKRIIGFTTGEGCFGEYNVTVSAKTNILKDIQTLLKRRLKEKFSAWNNTMAEKSADYCISLTESFDGSRILKALNPYDYEIHNFLAYALTVKELGINKPIEGKYVSRNLLNMDSYRHWFESEESNSRPDFMLIEIPLDDSAFDPDQALKIKIKMIECKMSKNIDGFIDEAVEQVCGGISKLSRLWSSENDSVSRRYWFTQLYRAIAFSKLGLNDNDEGFDVINSKIYNILNGKFEIEWSGDIYAYSLIDNNSDSLITEIDGKGVVDHITLHRAGQLFVQKMLLPDELQNEPIVYSAPVEPIIEEADEETASDPDIIAEPEERPVDLPKTSEVFKPFLMYLSDGKDCSRQNALDWFRNYYNLDSDTMNLKYDSNGNPKWETVLDLVISELRKNCMLENSEYGVFHITDIGMKVNNQIKQMGISELTLKTLSELKENMETSPSEANNQVPFIDDSEKSETNVGKSSDEAVPVYTLDDDSHSTIVPEKPSVSNVRILLGEDMRTKEKYYWEFGNKELNNRHLLINGNSGCGKTYCIQGLLMESALQGISSVVFDYTGGFTEDKLDPVFLNRMGDRVKQRVVYIEGIPVNPFKKGIVRVGGKDYPEKNVSVANRIAEIFKNVYSFGSQQTSSIYSAVMSALDSCGEHMTFKDMATELENEKADTVLSKIRPFIDLDPFVQGESFEWEHIRDNDEGIVYVIQFDGYGRDVQILLTELLLWDIWNFSVKTGDESKPLILVMDEAQNLSHGDKSPSAKILTEGRKFGISGWYATQFMKPQLSDDEIQRLQQAGQKLYFCPPDDGVMAVAKNIDINAQGAKDWSERLKKLKKGECVTCGSMVRNERWVKYDPKIIKVTSLQERLSNE